METKKKSMLDVFAEGAKSGMNIILNVMAPNSVFAFALIIVLQITGLMDLVGILCKPVMTLFGLPGESAAALVISFISTSGGLGAAAGLVTNGILTTRDISILLPGIMLVGAQLQYMGRILGPSGLASRHWKICMLISVFDCALAMLIMRFIV